MLRTKKMFALTMAIIIVFLATLPSNALSNDTIVADNTELSTLHHYAYSRNYTTGELSIIDLNNIPDYNYQSTHECLSDEELATTRAYDIAYYNSIVTAPINKLRSTNESSLSVIDPNSDYLYNGIVLVVIWVADDNGNEYCLSYGTGFMVSSNVVVSAGHVPYVEDPDLSVTVRVYPNIHYIAPSSFSQAIATLDGYPYVTVAYDIFSNSGSGDDWYVGALSSSINNAYVFNCTTPDIPLEGESVYTVGYGTNYKFRKVESSGVVLYEDLIDENSILSNYQSEEGISGGPVVLERSCIAIHNGSLGNSAVATKISDLILDVILSIILDNA